MNHPESILQRQAAWLCREAGLCFTHPANERKCSPQAGRRLKEAGQAAGVPDLLIFSKSTAWIPITNITDPEFPTTRWTENNYRGLAIELKSSTGRLTDAQKDFGCRLSDCGWKVVLCRTLPEVLETLRFYWPDNEFLKSVIL